MTLHAHFAVRRPQHTTQIELDGVDGEVIGIVGPNGAGKTTTLRAVAGLVPVTEGEIAIDGRVVSSPQHHVPPHRRDVGLVFQDHLLFPHLKVLDNIAFGPRARGASRSRARAQAQDWVERLGVVDLADRRPSQLSGGQAQRVAIARALATDPRVLLLDEPTAALDAKAAMGLRGLLRDHLHAFDGVSIVVTHTALDAMIMADRLIVVDGGRIVQAGPPAEVAARPRTQHVAALVGLNLVRGVADRGVVSLAGDAALVAAEQVSGQVFASFSPTAVSLFTDRPEGSPRNVWAGTVVSLAPHGDVVRVQIDSALPLIADITPAALATLRLVPGERVWSAVKATEVTVYAE